MPPRPLAYTYKNVYGGCVMREFALLVGQLFCIALLQMLLEAFLEGRKELLHALKMACLLGSLYLLLQYAYQYVIPELFSFSRLYL